MLRLIQAACAACLLSISQIPSATASCAASTGVTPRMVATMLDSTDVLIREFADSLGHGPKFLQSRGRLDVAMRRLRDLATPAPNPGLKGVLRLGELPPGASPKAESADSALEDVKLFLGTFVQPLLRDHAPPRFQSLMDPAFAIIDTQATRALEGSEKRLANYERKFGPRSVPMNALEAGLYVLVMQRVPGFGPSAECGPGPWELVAAYSPVYVTISDKTLSSTSIAEAGFRYYLFGAQWAQSGLKGLLRPAWFSFGAALASERDGSLRSPFQGTSRVGGFLAWGDLKLAVLGGPHPRLLVSRQFQLIRNVL